MPAGTPVEQTAAVLHELGAYLATVPEVTDYQAYAGTAAPINFNGLVRQYYLRAAARSATCRSIWSTSITAASRAMPSPRACARRCRRIGRALRRQRQGGRSAAGPAGAVAHRRRDLRPRGRRPPPGRQGGARACSSKTAGIVDVDDSSIAAAPKTLLLVDRRKAAMLGVPQEAIVSTLRAGLAGEAAALPARRRASTRRRRRCSCRPSSKAISIRCCSWRCAAPPASWCRSANW